MKVKFQLMFPIKDGNWNTGRLTHVAINISAIKLVTRIVVANLT